MADLTFSTTLLGQFLEDMEAYAEVKRYMRVLVLVRRFQERFNQADRD